MSNKMWLFVWMRPGALTPSVSRMVVRSAPVQVVEVEAGGAEVRQGFELPVGQAFPQPRGGVEGQVMVDELAQIGVGGRYLAVLFGIGLGLRGRGGLLS